jgi:hypothetical protein
MGDDGVAKPDVYQPSFHISPFEYLTRCFAPVPGVVPKRL